MSGDNLEKLSQSDFEQALKQLEKNPLEKSTMSIDLPEKLQKANLDEALQEFEEKSMSEQVPTNIPDTRNTDSSSKVRFEGEFYKPPVPSVINDDPFMVRVIMKLSFGLIKERKVAEYILFGVAILIFIFAMYLFFGGGKKPNKYQPSPLQRPSPMNIPMPSRK